MYIFFNSIFNSVLFHLSTFFNFFSPTNNIFTYLRGNKRNKRSRQAQSPSLGRELSASEVGTSQGNETIIETLSNFENVSSVREEGPALASGSQNEDEIQVRTQRMTEKTNKEVSDLRREMNEKLGKMLKVMKNSRTQSVPSRRYQEQNTPQVGTSKTQITETMKQTHLNQIKKTKYGIILF